MQSLAQVFDRLGEESLDHDIYTTLSPLYRAMYVARGRIDGQLRTVEELAPPSASAVLEVGCGTGDLVARLEGRFDRAIAADPSPAMARLAGERCRVVCQADASAFQPDSIDVAVLLGAVLGHIRPDEAGIATLEHVCQTLRPGGRVVCSVHRQLAAPRSRELTRTIGRYEITQRDEQRPRTAGSFEWAVSFELVDRHTSESRQVATSVTIRAFEVEELERWFREAGLSVLETRPREYVGGSGERDRAFLVVGECPE
jgi:SAM-dependent methyltransferase